MAENSFKKPTEEETDMFLRIASGCTALWFGGFMALFGVLAFNNPDLRGVVAADGTVGEYETVHCFVNDMNPTLCEALESPYLITGAGKDMTAKFLGLFTWSFYLNAIPVAGALMVFIATFAKNTITSCSGILAQAMLMVICTNFALLLWNIVAAATIWSDAGKTCAG